MFTCRTRDCFKKIKTSLNLFLVQGVKEVLVKLGSQGSALFVEGEEPIRQPIIPATEVIDTTGAGDTFTSAFAVVKERFSSLQIFMYLYEINGFVCITFNFICQTNARDLPARAMARVMH